MSSQGIRKKQSKKEAKGRSVAVLKWLHVSWFKLNSDPRWRLKLFLRSLLGRFYNQKTPCLMDTQIFQTDPALTKTYSQGSMDNPDKLPAFPGT